MISIENNYFDISTQNRLKIVIKLKCFLLWSLLLEFVPMLGATPLQGPKISIIRIIQNKNKIFEVK